MPRAYLIATQDIPGAAAAVLAAGVINPLTLIHEVEYDLAQIGITGMVMFDFLLCNGHKQHRFYAMHFDGQQFPLKALVMPAVRYDALSAASARVFQQRFDEADPSLCTPAMQFALKKGIPF